MEKSLFDRKVLTNFTRHFSLLKRLKIKTYRFAKASLFDTIFSDHHPNLVDFECTFGNGAHENWFRSCHVPLQRFAVKNFRVESSTLNVLENCCKDSLQTIKVDFCGDNDSHLIGRIFSTFHRLADVSMNIAECSALQDQPVLPHLEKLCVSHFSSSPSDSLTGFLKSYPQLKELHLKRSIVDNYLVEKIATMLPNLRSLSFSFGQFTEAIWMKLTSLRLEYFSPGFHIRWSVDDVRAFVREMPSLQRLTVWNVNDGSDAECSFLFKALRDDIRSSASNRQLWISRDDGKYFLLDSSEQCTDMAIDKFIQVNKRSINRILHC